MPQRDMPGTAAEYVRAITADAGNETFQLPAGMAPGRKVRVLRLDSASTGSTVTITVASGQSLDGVVNGSAQVAGNSEAVFFPINLGVWESSGLSSGSVGGTVTQSQVTGLTAALAAKADLTGGKLPITQIPTGSSGTTVSVGNDARLSDARTPLAHAASHAAAGADPLTVTTAQVTGVLPVAQIPTGTSGSTVALGNDARLSDARTPTAHSASHGSAGADAITLAQSQVTGLSTSLAGKADLVAGLIPTAQLPPLAVTTTNVVASQAAMLGLAAQQGDVAIRTDTGVTYILATNSPTTLADWKVLGGAGGGVTSVAGKSGTVSLAGEDITSGTVSIARLPIGTTSTTVPAGNDARFTDTRIPTPHASSHAVAGADPLALTIAQVSGTVPIGQLPTGATSTTVALGNDSRFTNARTPTAHAASHAVGGSDALTGYVASTTITTMVKLTQAAYDAIGTPAVTTLYVVVG